MSTVRQSMNHVWSEANSLGRGATAIVYQGLNKNNGEPVAVKTFNSSIEQPWVLQMREFRVLQKVKHKNIVKLLAIEEELQESHRKVIILELCTGGSLGSILNDPENWYGLEENEFLLVLDHVSSGMKYLRDNNLVHRDLKPDNIMKFICDDGSTIYKLTDFGAARELQDGQQFNSLYGTEEYLHPDIYERAVLRKLPGKTFGATVDLWSIGVTLYHVATGNLPFRPFGGRRNKETMYHITTSKESGVISGIQAEEKGPIDWNRELPNNCQLSAGLKKIVTPLLAGLLEANPKRIWSFETFFNQVMNVLSRKIVNIFHTNRATSIRVYIHPDEIYEHLQNYIKEQTDINSNNQILLRKEQLFIDDIGENSRAESYPNTTIAQPLILFCKENNNICTIKIPDIPRFPEFAKNLVSTEKDAKTACSIGHMCKKLIEHSSLSSNLMKFSVDCFINYLKNELRRTESKCTHLKEITSNHMLTSQSVHIAQTSINKGFKENKLKTTDFPNELKRISDDFLTETDPKVTQVFQKNVTENTLQLEWESSIRAIQCPAETKAPARAKTLMDRLRDSWHHLVWDYATSTLTYNNEQFHMLERIKITETNRRFKQLLESECIPAYNQIANSLGDWYKIAQTIYIQSKILDKDVATYENRLEKFSHISKSAIQTMLEQANDRITLNNIQKRKLKNILKKAERGKIESQNILGKNSEVMNQFNNSIAKHPLIPDNASDNEN